MKLVKQIDVSNFTVAETHYYYHLNARYKFDEYRDSLIIITFTF